MHHKKTTGSAKRAIKGIGKTNIKGEILTRVWIHLLWCNVIKSFGCLVISLDNLRPEFSRKFANWIRFKQGKLAGPILLPDLQRIFLFIDTNKDRRRAVYVEAFHLTECRRPHSARPHHWFGLITWARATSDTRHGDCERQRSHKNCDSQAQDLTVC